MGVRIFLQLALRSRRRAPRHLLPVAQWFAALDWFLFRFDWQHFFIALLRVEQLAGLLGCHLAGCSGLLLFVIRLVLRLSGSLAGLLLVLLLVLGLAGR